MRVYNLTDVNRLALKGGAQTIAIWLHRAAEPGGSVKAPGIARMDPYLMDLERKGAIAFDKPPRDYQIAKAGGPSPEVEAEMLAVFEANEVAEILEPEFVPAPEPVVEEPEDEELEDEDIPDRDEVIAILCDKYKKAEMLRILEEGEVEHDPKATKPVLAGIMYDAKYGDD